MEDGYSALVVSRRYSIRNGLNLNGLNIVGRVSSVDEAVAAAEQYKPGVVFLDSEFTPQGLAEKIHSIYSDSKIIVITEDKPGERLTDLNARAAGYINGGDPDELMEATLNQVLAGKYQNPFKYDPNKLAELTQYERQVFDLAGLGYNMKKVAEESHSKYSAVKNAKEKIIDKTGLANWHEIFIASKLEAQRKKAFQEENLSS